MLRKALPAIIVFAIVLFIIHSTVVNYAHKRIEQAVARRLKSRLGPAKSYRIIADGGLIGLLQGRLNGLHIQGTDVVMPKGFPVDELDIDAEGISFNAAKRIITGVEKTHFSAHISEDTLNSYLARKYPSLSGSKFTLGNGKLTFHTTPRISDVPVPVDAEGVLGIKKETKLVIKIGKLDAFGVKMPTKAFTAIEKKINPLFNTASWPFPAKLTSATANNGSLTITGNAALITPH